MAAIFLSFALMALFMISIHSADSELDGIVSFRDLVVRLNSMAGEVDNFTIDIILIKAEKV